MSSRALEYLWLEILAALPKIGGGILIIVAAWLLAAATRKLAQRLSHQVLHHGGRPELMDLLAAMIYWAVLALGCVAGLGTMGINVEALVASLGLTGFALGFALKDAIANVLAGALILTYRPFRYGDHIVVAGFEGVVIHIDLRYTTIQDGPKYHLIPNQTMYSNPVTVISDDSSVAAARGLEQQH